MPKKRIKVKQIQDLVGDPVNNYAPDDVGHNNNIFSNNFANGGTTNGLKTYDKVGHQFSWFIPSPTAGGVTANGEPYLLVG